MLIFQVLGVISLSLILILFFFLLNGQGKWESLAKSVFECGFSSYFFSRFSFSIHYFSIALTFLLLDLELCFLFPLFNENNQNLKSNLFLLGFAFILTLVLVLEWIKNFLDWKK